MIHTNDNDLVEAAQHKTSFCSSAVASLLLDIMWRRSDRATGLVAGYWKALAGDAHKPISVCVESFVRF
jgi:hypothetical protein